MSDALLAGVSGLQAHQQMLDVTGNNLANVNTYSYKSSQVTFGELLSQTIREATQPTASVGGTNPQQIGSGVKVSSVDRNMAQGNLIHTGQPLNMAIQGEGYFVLNDGQKNVYTRVGAFAVDAGYYLVDPGTGYRVQRIGTVGVEEGFQDPGSTDIQIPYNVSLAPKATENLLFSGNLSADGTGATTHLLSSGTQYTAGGAVASVDTLLSDLDQGSGLAAGDTIHIQGTNRAGTAVDTDFTIAAGSTVSDLLGAITAAFSGSTASLSSGEIRLTDTASGYSQTDVLLSYSGGGSLELPTFFRILQAGGAETRNANVEIFDSEGIGHVATVAFVRTNTPSTWDAVLTSITGDLTLNDRRIKGITFNGDGSYGGIGGATPDDPSFRITYDFDPANIRQVTLNMGTVGQFDGLSQFGGASTVAASGQDGYEAGHLSSVSVSREGVLVGQFTNGVRRDIAALQLANFQNPAGLESMGGGYFTTSANSGDPVPTTALGGGAGSVNGGSLEQSNVDMASEFVNLIQAQNGYQANARTIRVANDMLRELTNLIR
jgi:flagellar hook protein FlgE